VIFLLCFIYYPPLSLSLSLSFFFSILHHQIHKLAILFLQFFSSKIINKPRETLITLPFVKEKHIVVKKLSDQSIQEFFFLMLLITFEFY